MFFIGGGHHEIMKNGRNNFLRTSAALLAAVTLAFSAGCSDNASSNGSGNNSANNSSVTNSGAGNSDGTVDHSDKNVGEFGLTKSIEDGAIFHAWCQSFNTIKESMRDIAYAGFSTIQTSPINACVVGANGGMQLNGEGKWYYHYQPTDWTIGNYQLGTKEEFTAMCEEAHKYGIKVIVDVVPNHTASDIDSVQQGLIDAVGGMDNLYHENGFNEISDWSDRLECTTGQVGGLPDVNTENKDFQDYFIKYLNECIACGADGFRYDTAKHIGLPSDPVDPKSEKNNFWERVTSEIDNADTIFNYGEALQSDGEKIEEYQAAIGATTASAYGEAVRNALASGKLDAAELTDLKINVDDPHAVTWVESHDNYCNDGTSMTLSDKQVILGWAVIAARGKGTPLFYDRPYGNTSGNQWGTMNYIGAMGNQFYKDDTVVAVNRFRNAMAGEDEKLSNPDSDENVLVIERGSRGVTIVNAGRYSYNLNESVSLPDGKYIDRVDGETEFTVENGVLTGVILSNSVVVLYNEGYLDIEDPGTLSAEIGSFILTEGGDTVSAKLCAVNAKNTVYSLGGAEFKEFADGDVIEIGGSDIKEGSALTLTLKSRDDSGNDLSTVTYYFTVQGKRSVDAGTTIYFNKPDSWGEKIYAYVYDESTGEVRQAAPWPGVECELGADGMYSYTFTEDWDNVLLIFTDGSNQFPNTMEPGMVVEADKIYTAG